MKIIIRESQYKRILNNLNEDESLQQSLDSAIKNLKDASISGGLSKEKKGSMKYKTEVVSLQLALTLLEIPLPIHGVDGLYGPETGNAVKTFIEKNFDKDKQPTDKHNATPEVLNKIIQKLEGRTFSDQSLKKIEKFADSPEFTNVKVIGDIPLPDKFAKIPAGSNNYRSSQPTTEQLDYIIKKFGIKNVIRFNSDKSSDSKGVLQSTERKICEKNNCKFHPLSSRGDQDKVNSLLSQGNTLIHCRWGADRTGGNVGGWLYSIGWGDTQKIWDYTTKYNRWEEMVKNNPNKFVNGGYLKQSQKFGVKNLNHAKTLL